jgi:hypothetical protein
VSGAAVAEATSAPVGSGLAGAGVGEVLDDGQSFAKGHRHEPASESAQAPVDETKRMPDPEGVEARRKQWAEHYGGKVESGQKSGPIHPPEDRRLPGFPNAAPAKRKTAVQGGGGLRMRWKDHEGNIYEWDSQHGTVEKYNARGKHLGEFDPNTGAQTKPADKTRSVEP